MKLGDSVLLNTVRRVGALAGRRLTKVRSFAPVWWLRRMKRLVRAATFLGPVEAPALRVLSVLPSGWTAYVRLSEILSASDLENAYLFADRAVLQNPGVWQGHVIKVQILDAQGKAQDSCVMKMAALCLMGDASVSRAVQVWSPGQEVSDRDSALADCRMPSQAMNDVVRELGRLAGPDNPVPFRRFVEAVDSATLAEIERLGSELSEPAAIAIARELRKRGDVTSTIEFLSFYQDSTKASSMLRGARQDAAAMSGELAIPRVECTPYPPDARAVFYMLHNSLPYNSGGYATRTHGLIRALRDRGRDMIPITRPGFPSEPGLVFRQRADAPPIDLVDDIQYHRILGDVSGRPRTDLSNFVKSYVDGCSALREMHRPGIFHGVSNWWNGYAAIASARALDLPSVYEVRGLWELTRVSREPSWSETERFRAEVGYERQAALAADAVIAITDGLRDELIKRGVPGEKISVVPNSVDLAAFARIPFDDRLAAQYDIDRDDVVIGFAGSLTFYEGLDDLLRAGALVRERTGTPMKFLFVGDGPVLETLQSLADELGLSKVTRFVGRVPHGDVRRYLSLMSITPFPRRPLPVTELVSPLKPLESMASHIAVMASNVRALAEMIPEGTGMLFEKGNVEALAEALQRMVESEALRQEFAENAYDWVRENRSWHRAAALVDDVYRQIAN